MPHSVFKVFLELEISNLQRFKILVEVEARMRLTYLEYGRFLWDGRLLNLFLLQCLSYLCFKLYDLHILLTLNTF